jgi:hypothetical protein
MSPTASQSELLTPTSIPSSTSVPITPATLAATNTAVPTATSSPTPAPTSTPAETSTATPTHTPQPTRTPTPVATLNPAGRVGLGAYLEGTPYDEFAAAQQFETLLKHKMEFVLWFQAWGNDDSPFPTYWAKLAAEKGFIPVITWEPWKRNFENPSAVQPEYALSSISEGNHDAYIRSWARSAQSLGVPIVIRFAHEQSTEPGTRPWYPWQGDPQGYQAAFRHIVALFREAGASNVEFLWSAMWLNEWAAQYYPGHDIVDVVGTTTLNHGTGATAEWARWRTFDELFAGQYEAALQWNKPVMITELATAEQGGDKAAWLRECFTSMETKYPLVMGVLLLEVESDREWPIINWSVASSDEGLSAFREAIANPYFK